ncbi:MAG: LysR family transcriptional regulator [Pseudomonadota bacterium]
METAFLQSFVLVAETGSMAEAARRQDLTPAAVAQQVRALERELRATLVARSGRTVLPTPAGHRLLERAGELLREVGNLHALVRDDVVAGELRLGAINTALHTILPRILGRLARKHPDVTVFIQSGNSQQLVDGLRGDQLDAAVCLHPDFGLAKAMAWEQLREESLVVLAPPALAGSDPLELLRTEPLLRYDRSLGGGRQADRYLRRHGIVPIERFELSSLLAISMMVHEGLGVSLVPDIASPLTAGLKLARIALHDAGEARRFGVLWRRGTARAGLVAAFLAQAKAEVRKGK